MPCLIVAASEVTVITQTWHATSLHSPGKEAVVSQTWHALHSPGNEWIVLCQEDFEPKSETLFDLQGRKVTSDLDNLKPGVYISIKGNKPSKIIVR
ncbi:MAG: T9SS type A sorting domain-containing protein [Bacteroides sp.]|nr:T9SS type A sorting domain-containing protein [Bacteroides sp.]